MDPEEGSDDFSDEEGKVFILEYIDCQSDELAAKAKAGRKSGAAYLEAKGSSSKGKSLQDANKTYVESNIQTSSLAIGGHLGVINEEMVDPKVLHLDNIAKISGNLVTHLNDKKEKGIAGEIQAQLNEGGLVIVTEVVGVVLETDKKRRNNNQL
ncbi:hypothetical protein ABZP36_016981 [Zizania latifolia]